MKKLIKDLTREEINRICKKHLDENNGNCSNCPLYSITSFDSIPCIHIPEEIKKFNEDINKEVETPEEGE